MDQATLPQVHMPNRNGFIRDDRPDTKAVRCMTDCK
jgi:cytochrome c